MKSLYLISLIFVGLACLTYGDFIPPVFDLDLDLPPRQRWQPIYGELLKNRLFAGFLQQFISRGSQSLRSHGCDENCVSRVNNVYKKWFPEYYEEIQGIADLVQPLGITTEMIVMEQFRYEWTVLTLDVPDAERERLRSIKAGEVAATAKAKEEAEKQMKEMQVDEMQIPLHAPGCTSTLVCDANNQVLHGRNLDWFEAPHFASTMFRVNFKRGGKLLFQSEQLAGLFGVLTIVRPGAFSMSLNARIDTSAPTLEQALDCFENVPMQPVMTALRYYTEHFDNYDDIMLNNTKSATCSPYYGIIGGMEGKGSRTQHILPQKYDDYTAIVDREDLKCEDNSWHLVECNSDFDVPAVKEVDVRRFLISNELNTEKRAYGTTPVGLFHAMTVTGVKNARSVHTTIMSPKDGEIFTIAYDK